MDVWSAVEKAQEYRKKCAELENILSGAIPHYRSSLLLASLSTGGPYMHAQC